MAEYTSGYTGAQIDTHLGTVAGSNLSSTNKITRSATIVVAASDSSAAAKEQADYVCDGTADNVQIQAALDALPAGGGEVHLCEGHYVLAVTVSRAIDNVTISGAGYGTYISYNASDFLFSVGSQNNWTFTNIRIDYGRVDRGTGKNWAFENVWFGTYSTTDPTHIDSWSEGHMFPRSSGGFLPEAHRHPLVNVLDDFEGSDWTTDTGTLTWDSSTVYSRAQSLKIVTGSGTAATLEKATTYPDLTDCSFGIWVYTPDYTKISKIALYVRTTDTSWTHYAYLSEDHNYTISGGWHFVVFAHLPQTFGTPDLTSSNLMRIKVTPVAGESATVYLDRLTYWKRTLTPHGAITFSFDDGLASTHDLAKPLFDKYGYRGVYSVVCRSVDADGLSRAKALQIAGWDVVSHSFDHTIAQCTNDPIFQYGYSQKWLADNGFESGSRFALIANGIHSATLANFANNSMAFARSSIAHRNGLNSLPGLGTFMYSEVGKYTVPVATIEGWIDEAVANGLWLNIMFHDIAETPSAEYDFSVADLGTLIEYCHTVGIEVLTFSQVVERIRNTSVSPTVSGTGTIPNGSTSVNIRHGFSQAPTSIQITPTSSLGSAASIWVSSKDTGTGNLFTVSCNTDPGADVTFEWVATL